MSTLQERIDADTAKFVSTTLFGKAGTYTPSSGSAIGINLIFDKTFEAVDPISGMTVEARILSAIVRTVDVPNPKKNETVVIGAVTYYVAESRPQSTGFTRLILSEEQQHA